MVLLVKKMRILGLLAILACGGPPLGTQDNGRDLPSNLPPRWLATGIIAGRVIDPNGDGVAAASVSGTMYMLPFPVDRADSSGLPCVGRLDRRALTLVLSTDASGYFRLRTVAGSPQMFGCVVLEAVPPPGSEWASAEADGLTLFFTTAYPEAVLDSINVTIRLLRR